MPASDISTPARSSGLINAIASICGQAIPLLAFFLAAPYLLSALGAQSFGVLTLFITANTVIASIDCGLGAGAVRSLGKIYHSDEAQNYCPVLLEWWLAYVLFAVFISVAALLTGSSLGQITNMHVSTAPLTGKVALYSFAVSIIASYASAAAQLIARSREQFVGLTFIQALNGLLLWAGLTVVVALGGGINSALCWPPIAITIGFILHIAWAWRLSGGWTWLLNWRLPHVKSSLSYCLHAFWGQLAGNATYQADKFVVSRYLGTAQTGHYGLITNIASKLLMLVATIASFVFPRIVRLQTTDENDGIRLTYLRASRYTLLVSWPAFIVLSGFSAPFLTLWLGDNVGSKLIYPMRLLMLAYFINSLSIVASNVFNGMGDASTGARFSTLGGIITVAGGILMTPSAGLNGAAIAALLASLQVFLFTHKLHKRLELRAFPLARLWLQLIAVSTIPVGFVLFANLFGLTIGWVGLFLSATAVYTLFYATWFFSGCADEGDRMLVSHLNKIIRTRISL